MNTPLAEDESFYNFQESYFQYTQSHFLASYRTSFCLAYWQFLRKILTFFHESPLLYSEILQAITGFGTFGIGFSVENPIAAGVFNLTHPVYQTAKLQIPSRPESSKYLPRCAVYLPSKKNAPRLPEFYYYRQLAFGMREDARFLLCLAVNPEIRFSSFEALHSFAERIHSKKDTRIQEQASFLVPVIRTTFHEKTEIGNSTFRVADIGRSYPSFPYKFFQKNSSNKNIFERIFRNGWKLKKRTALNLYGTSFLCVVCSTI